MLLAKRTTDTNVWVLGIICVELGGWGGCYGALWVTMGTLKISMGLCGHYGTLRSLCEALWLCAVSSEVIRVLFV